MGLCGSSEATVAGRGDSESNGSSSANVSVNVSAAQNDASLKANGNSAKPATKAAEPTTTIVASQNNNNNNNQQKSNDTPSNTATTTTASSYSTTNTNNNGNSTSSTNNSNTSGVDGAEFRDTAKLVVLLVLERLVRALDYERESLITLAEKLHNSASPIALAGGAAIEKFLRDSYDIDASIAPSIDTQGGAAAGVQSSATSISPRSLQIASDDMQRFSLLIATAQQVNYRLPLPSVPSCARSLVTLATAIQSALANASSHPSTSSDIKLHLAFFAKAFSFATKGDIVANPQLLFQNIDDVTKE